MSQRWDQFPNNLWRYGELYRSAGRLILCDGAIYPALRVLQGDAFAAFNHWFGNDTVFGVQAPSDMCLALCMMAAVVETQTK